MKIFLSLLLFSGLVLGCDNCNQSSGSDLIQVEMLTENVYVHISNMNVPLFGPFACNGLIYVADQEALIYDTPPDELAAAELIQYVEEELGATIIGVVVTHFHVDCLGGLAVFHEHGIPSYAQQQTLSLAQQDGWEVPQNGFTDTQELSVGEQIVINAYFGEGHTVDNMVGYLPAEQVLFGGCLVKEVGASQGNITDANLAAWSNTVQLVQNTFPEVQYVVPGHGTPGGVELLEYTIQLFAPE